MLRTAQQTSILTTRFEQGRMHFNCVPTVPTAYHLGAHGQRPPLARIGVQNTLMTWGPGCALPTTTMNASPGMTGSVGEDPTKHWGACTRPAYMRFNTPSVNDGSSGRAGQIGADSSRPTATMFTFVPHLGCLVKLVISRFPRCPWSRALPSFQICRAEFSLARWSS